VVKRNKTMRQRKRKPEARYTNGWPVRFFGSCEGAIILHEPKRILRRTFQEPEGKSREGGRAGGRRQTGLFSVSHEKLGEKVASFPTSRSSTKAQKRGRETDQTQKEISLSDTIIWEKKCRLDRDFSILLRTIDQEGGLCTLGEPIHRERKERKETRLKKGTRTWLLTTPRMELQTAVAEKGP